MNKYRLLQVLLIVTFGVSVGLLYYHMVYLPKQNQKQVEALKEEFPEDTSGEDSKEEPLPSGEEGGIGNLDLLALQSRYPDIKAWITIPDTGIDYPVLQSTEDDPEYYLKHNYQKEYDVNGSLFFAYNCDLKKSDNLVIYGHNMNSGAMFGNLDAYADSGYCMEHPSLYLQTADGVFEYTIVSVLKTDAGQLPFLQVDFPGHDGLLAYVDQAKRMDLFDTGVSLPYYEQLVTLVTCAYDYQEERLVVIAGRAPAE